MTLAVLRKLAEKATPGPWDISPRNSLYPLSVVIETSRLTVAHGHSTADIDYIAACNPETIKQLIAKVEGLSDALRKIKGVVIHASMYDADPLVHSDLGDIEIISFGALAKFGADVPLNEVKSELK